MDVLYGTGATLRKTVVKQPTAATRAFYYRGFVSAFILHLHRLNLGVTT